MKTKLKDILESFNIIKNSKSFGKIEESNDLSSNIETLDIIGEEDLCLDTESKKRKRLIASANMIYQELTTEYAHLKHKEKLFFEDGRVYYSSFSKKVKDILGVYVNSQSVPFKVYPLYMEAEVDGFAEVKYIYHADDLELDDEVILPPQYTAYVLATGVAMNTFIVRG